VVRSYQPFEHLLDEFNRKSSPRYPVYLSCSPAHLTEAESKAYFAIVEELSAKIDAMQDMATTRDLLLQRAVAYTVTQAYDDAIADLNTAIGIDSTFTLAYWQRAACFAQQSPLMEATSADMLVSRAIDDLTTAIGFDTKNAYLYYDRANLYVLKKDYQRAIDDYTAAIGLNPNIPEVHYNRGIARIQSGNTQEGIQDLSRAGELGIYAAYSVIKKYSK
jgi:tetratricopeptide (TPR) repeat protein